MQLYIPLAHNSPLYWIQDSKWYELTNNCKNNVLLDKSSSEAQHVSKVKQSDQQSDQQPVLALFHKDTKQTIQVYDAINQLKHMNSASAANKKRKKLESTVYLFETAHFTTCEEQV